MSEQTIALEFSGAETTRLDKFLVQRLPAYSRSRLQALIKDGQVTVDNQTALKSSLVLDRPSTVMVRIPPPEPSRLQPEAIPLDIIFENDDLMVINKPAGMVVHPAAGHGQGTLVHAALAHAPEMEGIGGEQRPGVVHRLDKNTSGLILLAKNDRTHRMLQEQFKQRKVHKVYLALVDGQPPTPTGRIEAAIGRNPGERKLMAVVSDLKGRPAISDYRTLARYFGHTLLEVQPLTGRTHQIRLHLAFIGCPVAGDTIYGGRRSTVPLARHFLHAARLSVTLPGEDQPRSFEAPLPPELTQILDSLTPLN